MLLRAFLNDASFCASYLFGCGARTPSGRSSIRTPTRRRLDPWKIRPPRKELWRRLRSRSTFKSWKARSKRRMRWSRRSRKRTSSSRLAGPGQHRSRDRL